MISKRIVQGRFVIDEEHVTAGGKKIKATGITIIHFRDGNTYRDEFESGSPSFADQVK